MFSRKTLAIVAGCLAVGVSGSTTSAVYAAGVGDGWVRLASMPTGRQGVAVVSLGGNVYAVGGVGTGGTTGALQSYDPATDSWATLAPMPTPRAYLGAVAVGGKIYAVGGFDSNGNDVTTTEVYRPGSNSWVTGPPLLEAQGGVAVASSNGRIFAIGGSANDLAVEALTPGGSWENMAPLPTGRYEAAAATAADGRIIVMGGFGPGAFAAPTATVEAYDPTSNTWSGVAPMSFGRVRLAAATGSDGRIYAIGGDIGDNPYSFPSVEAFDPTTNAWTLVGGLAVARNGLGATLGPDGRIYAIGGSNELDASASTAVEAYTPPSTMPAGWTLGPSLPAARWGLSAAVSQNGTILVAGGESSTGALLSTSTIFDPTANAWSPGPSLPEATYRSTLTPAPNGVHLVGGWTSAGATSQHPVYAVWSGGTWQAYAAVPGRRELAGAAIGPDGSLYVAGGDQGGTQYLSSAERYAPWQNQASDTWAPIASLPTPRTGGVLASGNDGRLYLIGGLAAGGYLSSVEAYDPTTNTWSSAARLPDPRFAAAGLAGPDGRIYVLGGFDPVAGDVRRLDIYSPATNTWTCGPPMPSASSNLATALLDDNIYALGGIHGSTTLATSQVYHVGVIPPDPTPPTFTTTPTIGFSVGSTLGTVNVPVQMRWQANASATDIRRYAFAISANGGGFTAEPLPWDVINNVLDYLPHGTTPYQLQLTATDCTGNISQPSNSSPFAVRAYQETSAHYTGSWTTGTLTNYYGGHTRYATQAGARASYTFTGNTIALVSEKRPSEGQAYIAIDGHRVATINLHTTTTSYRQIVYSHTFPTQGTHTIWVTLLGTAGHPRVDVDAFTQIQTTAATAAEQTGHHPKFTIVQPTITPLSIHPTQRTS